MTERDELTTRLTGLGLTGEQALLYVCLLEEGPKTVPSLARAVSVTHADATRALIALIEDGLVHPSLQWPSAYVATKLDFVIEALMRRSKSKLQDAYARTSELKEFFRQHYLHPSANTHTVKVLRNVREIASTTLVTLLYTEAEFLWIAPKEGLHIASTFGINGIVRELCEHGGCVRGITDITADEMPLVQEVLDIGEEVRHYEGYRGISYGIFDRMYCISAININIKQVRPDTSASMLYANDSAYAASLVPLFELIWKQSVPAEQRIDELLKQWESR